MIKQEWTALQNLPSLPRDLTTVDLGVGLETEDDSAMIPFGDESAGAVAAMHREFHRQYPGATAGCVTLNLGGSAPFSDMW